MSRRAPMSMCFIFREDPLFEQAVASVRPYVEEICVVVDDDAPDGSFDRARSVADRLTVEKWRDDFSFTRNVCLALATRPMIGWCDSDDVVVGAEHFAREIESARKTHPGGRLLAPYDYSFDPKTGEVTRQQWRERIVPNDGSWVWEHPTHEGLVKKNGHKIDPGTDYWMKGVRWVHKRTETGARSRSLYILLKWHAAGHDDAWTHFNLAQELHAANRYREALDHFGIYLTKSDWVEEKALACCRAADCEVALNLQDPSAFERAAGWLDKAEKLRPDDFEPRHARAKLAMMRASLLGDATAYGEVKANCLLALSAPETRTPIGRNPQERGYDVLELLRNAAEAEEDWQVAKHAAEQILEKRLDSPPHLLALKRYRVQMLLASTDPKAEAPEPKKNGVTIKKVAAPRQPLDVVFMCGPSGDPWNPEIVERYGAGGSETAVVEVAKRLAKLGHRVRVYNNPGQEGTYGGVDYELWTPEVKPTCDVLVAWRLAALLPQADAKVRLAWAHDTEIIGCNYGYSLLADRFLALSKWHKENLIKEHGIPESQVFQTRNGVDPALYEGASMRNPRKAIYCSSPDRGLGALLDMWPAIRERLPNAELDVFYSFASWEKQANAAKNEQHRFLCATLKRRMKSLEPYGVRYRGLVNRATLAKEMRTSGALLMPNWFPETSCLSVMEARAAGMRIVATPIAALPETVGEFGVLIAGDWLSDDFQERFTAAAVGALSDNREWGHTREEQSLVARNELGWDGVVRSWSDLFYQLMQEASYGMLPAYREFRQDEVAL